MAVDIKYPCTPFDGTPGQAWETFEENLGARGFRENRRRRGWSLANTLLAVDEGSAGGPALPGGAAATKAQGLRRRRMKDSYALLVTHVLDRDHTPAYAAESFPGWFCRVHVCGRAAIGSRVDRMRLRELDAEWDKLDTLQDVGVDENSVANMAKKIKALNSKRPVAQRHNQTVQTRAERLDRAPVLVLQAFL